MRSADHHRYAKNAIFYLIYFTFLIYYITSNNNEGSVGK